MLFYFFIFAAYPTPLLPVVARLDRSRRLDRFRRFITLFSATAPHTLPPLASEDWQRRRENDKNGSRDDMRGQLGYVDAEIVKADEAMQKIVYTCSMLFKFIISNL